MKKQAYGYKAVRLVLSFCIVSIFYDSYGQTKDLQKTQFDSLQMIFASLKSDLAPLLSKKDRSILIAISDSLLDEPAINAYSQSRKRRVFFSRGLSDLMVKDIVADIISTPQLHYVPGFHDLFMRLYPVLASEEVPEVAAELSSEEQRRYQAIKRLPTFYAKYRNYVEFIYLHEVAHILKDFDDRYEKILGKLQRHQLTKEAYDSLLLNEETAADNFALTMLQRCGRNPKESFGVYRLMYFQKEHQLYFIRTILDRATNFYVQLAILAGCNDNSKVNPTCDSIYNKTAELLLQQAFYPRFDSSSFTKTVDSVRDRKFSLRESLWYGNFYLLGTSYNIRNVEVAYHLFSNYDYTQEDIDALNAVRDIPDLDDLKTLEYILYCAGKIQELYFHNFKKAISHYEQARDIAILLSREYYERLLQRLK